MSEAAKKRKARKWWGPDPVHLSLRLFYPELRIGERLRPCPWCAPIRGKRRKSVPIGERMALHRVMASVGRACDGSGVLPARRASK